MVDNQNSDGIISVIESGKVKKNDIGLIVEVDGYNKIQDWFISFFHIKYDI